MTMTRRKNETMATAFLDLFWGLFLTRITRWRIDSDNAFNRWLSSWSVKCREFSDIRE